MKNTFTKEWFKAALIRAVKTAAQVVLSMITIGAAIKDVDWVNVASVAAVAFLYSIVTSLAGLPEVSGEDGVLLIDTTDPDVDRYLLKYNTDLEDMKTKSVVKFKVDPNATLMGESHDSEG